LAILKFVKIRKFLQLLKFMKFDFSNYGLRGIVCCCLCLRLCKHVCLLSALQENIYSYCLETFRI